MNINFKKEKIYFNECTSVTQKNNNKYEKNQKFNYIIMLLLNALLLQ